MSSPLRPSHPPLDAIAAALMRRPGGTTPVQGNPARAAVAIVFRPLEYPDLLLIRRAEREGDPWSGQMALPGGRYDPGDSSLLATAVRETFEETGLELAPDESLLGALDELHPLTPLLPPILITPYVFVTRRDVTLRLSDEVADAVWVPWSHLLSPATACESTVRVRGAEFRTPSFVLGPNVVWGLTQRILQNLIEVTR